MLEIKNLTKIYKSKKAEPVVALNNISLTFNNTGMVFLLGKSGSGKSTLLNVLGGLDKFDSGEIIINGKSSSTFKESDFDSYRNTYLGFIFQEYNILSEFTVYKNIEFALELQGKKADKESVNHLLEQVDLVGYGKRKPNELSGGQKQRIAIARALVKNPQIIMADEPTGALDSNTGKQVLDTLKNLSKEKLVIVVSHDREFAEQYADRIIELKDGNVISDSTKRLRDPKTINEGFNIVDENVIHIEAGHKFSQEEVSKLNQFLKDAKGDIILTSDQELNKNVKKLAKITDNGKREYFDTTVSEDLEKNDKEELKLIKSRLKFKDSLKMGASGLKTKKFRLFMTILLSAVALTMFGLADTMASFNAARSSYDSIMKMDQEFLSIDLRHIRKSGNYSYAEEANIGDGEIAELKEEFPDYEFKKIHSPTSSNSSISWSYSNTYDSVSGSYYIDSLNGIASLTEDDMETFGLKFVESSKTQHVPQAENEIVISKYHYEIFKKFGYAKKSGDYGDPTKKDITSPDILLGETINFNGTDFTIVGILDENVNETKYQELKDIVGYNNMTTNLYMLMNSLQNDLNSGFINNFYFSEGYIEKNAPKILSTYNYDSYYEVSDQTTYYGTTNQSYNVLSKPNADIVFFDKNKSTLEEDEVLIGKNMYFVMNGSPQSLYLYNYVSYFEFNNERYETKNQLEDAVRNYFSGTTLYLNFLKTDEDYNYFVDDSIKYKIVGIYYDTEVVGYDSGIYFKDIESMPKNIRYSFNTYKSVITKLSGNRFKDRELIMYLSQYQSTEDVPVIRSEVSIMLENFVDMIETMSKVFLYVGIGFAVFSALLLMNFIGISISYKKKEIGILRALGARGRDVYGIFLNESLIITLINFVVSLVFTIGGVILINYFVTKELGIHLTLLSFGIRQILLLLAVSVVVAVVASFLPTHKVSKMKPIDAILDRKTK